MKVFIHLGLHKTASTFLQKRFFYLLEDNNNKYINLRVQAPKFLNYILYENDLLFDNEIALKKFTDEIPNEIIENKNVIISDEQFCGSPWDNASMRKIYFDRLNKLFPSAKYLLILRNQSDLIESLYLQYIKTGGSVSWKDFLKSKRFPLLFGLKAYLNFDIYIDYIVSQVGKNRLACFNYEELLEDPLSFLNKITSFINPKKEINNDELMKIINVRDNKSISPFFVRVLIVFNKFCKSERQPYLIFPRKLHSIVVKLLTKVSISTRRNKIIPIKSIEEFCNSINK